ncbi:MAG: hypothetical protein DI603_13075 [Roseateles depolymerans]|uniref:Uncharacterized protein n=1 Tax=Roseateles depolymerans TaxID=76731 RepID=A0A2W5DKV9_9BURK|nr:MAG: hypothetical protein DI603_13075 [Roseateles depolymerans]
MLKRPLQAAALILCAALPLQHAMASPSVKHPRAVAKKQPAPAPEPVLEAASDEQLAAAQRAYLGDYACEAKQTVHIAANPKTPGYIDVSFQKQVLTMKPVLSSTGALRLEDVTGRTLMIQIANKSMLLDTKIGQRLVDDCVHPEQARLMAEARAAAAANPEAVNSGLGISAPAAR